MWLALKKSPEFRSQSYAVIGVYLYDGTVFEKIKRLKPSGRGELEITDVNNFYVRGRHIDLRNTRGLVDRRGHI